MKLIFFHQLSYFFLQIHAHGAPILLKIYLYGMIFNNFNKVFAHIFFKIMKLSVGHLFCDNQVTGRSKERNPLNNQNLFGNR